LKNEIKTNANVINTKNKSTEQRLTQYRSLLIAQYNLFKLAVTYAFFDTPGTRIMYQNKVTHSKSENKMNNAHNNFNIISNK
jgi:uncharacterized membrane protein